MTSRALFLVSNDGQGHQVRCRALAAELTERGWGCTLTSGYVGTDGSFDIVIADDYKIKAEEFDQFTVPTVAIVDHADHEADELMVDLLVNGCAGARPEMYAQNLALVTLDASVEEQKQGIIGHTMKASRRVLAGPAYSLLREPFRTFVWEPQGETHFDARRLDGASSPTIANRMASAQVVVTRAGMRAMEAACVGAPLILAYEGAAHEENVQLNASGLVKAGVAVDCHDSLVGSMLGVLMRDDHRRAQMSQAGRKLVDGLGVKRVADAIARLVA